IRGNYTRELNATGTAVSELLQWHLFETPEQVAQYFDSLIRDIGAALIELGHYLHSPPLIYNNTLTSANETYIPDACMSWPVLGSYPKSSNYYWSPPILSQWPPAKTWALSAFAKVNSTDEICGWAYPVNGSNLAVPYNHYAAVPLSVWQGGYDYGLRPVAVLAQGAAQIWPPALIYNVWFVDQYWLTPFGPGSVVLWGGYTPLASPADWLGLGAEFCISISQTSPNSYIYIDGHIGGANYKMATVAESLSNSSEMTVTPGAGFTQSVYVGLGTSTQKPVWGVIAIDMASNVLVYVPLSGVNDTMGSVGAAALGYNLPVVLYPSMAFETDDTSSSFFNYNTNFAVGFEMGPNPSNPGSWPLYYSISNNTAYCASQGYNIWGSSGVGTSWPPANTVWGASGATLQPNYYLAAVGSISQMQNSGLLNVYPISCQYVDGQLSSLNTYPFP
ncbi:MAG: hypothetical protein QXG88_00005, partial [Thermoproteus sp.]